jgi:hypothetical protein
MKRLERIQQEGAFVIWRHTESSFSIAVRRDGSIYTDTIISAQFGSNMNMFEK